jgi:hypothetical protein
VLGVFDGLAVVLGVFDGLTVVLGVFDVLLVNELTRFKVNV